MRIVSRIILILSIVFFKKKTKIFCVFFGLPEKSYSSFTILKFLFFAIGMGLVAMFLGVMTFMAFAAQKIGFLGYMTGSAFMLSSAILSIAYVIALGVYIGVNSK